MGISGWQLILVLVIVFVLFGAGKLPRVMGDLGRGVRSMKDGLNGKEELTLCATDSLLLLPTFLALSPSSLPFSPSFMLRTPRP